MRHTSGLKRSTNVTVLAPLCRLASGALLALGCAAVFAQAPARAQSATDALPFANGFLVTGNYVVAGVDLPKDGGPGTIHLGNDAVPADADIIAAYLYWETITRSADPITGATFAGQPIQTAKVSTLTSLPGPGASCWGAAGGSSSTLAMARADVLPLLPKRYDSNNQWTGKYLVNGQNFVVTLPQQGTGNVLTQSAGATLLLVFRDQSRPLRKVVIYDGAYAQAQGTTMSQTIRAIYKSSLAKSAKITHIVGSGAGNTGERLLFNGTVKATNPFPAPIDASSDRGWASPTYDVSSLMPGTTTNDGYGETVTTSVDHGANNQNSTPYECLAWAAVVFSTSEADVDADGVPDGVEDASAGLKDPPTPYYPNGQPLPNLNQMGANSTHKDLFIEVNAMWAPANTSYGSTAAPYSSTSAVVTDPAGHNHLPMPAILKSVGDTYVANGIHAHFDVGDTAAYYALPGYACPNGQPDCDATPYLVPSAYARGGEAVQERACVPNGTVECQFPAYPGTIGWRMGLQLYQDSPVGDGGQELTTDEILQTWGAGTHRRRFDRIRDDYFHYLFYGHARGKARSPHPCLDGNGNEVEFNQTTPIHACVATYTDNPLFHTPSSTSGVADLPGAVAMITLGMWDNFVGTPFVQTSTTLHELGHNLNLWHGGAPPLWGNQTTATSIEPNCKPSYLSSMSYLYQVHGLFDDLGEIHANYSGNVRNSINETSSLTDAQLLPFPALPVPNYVPAWYAPAGSYLAVTSGSPQATRFCSGPKFDPNALPAPMARVHAATSTSLIDWNGDGSFSSSPAQDINFDGTLTNPLAGYDDWANVRLDQIGASREFRIFTSGSGDYQDLGSGDFTDLGSGDFADLGSGDFLNAGAGTFLVHFASGAFLGDYLNFGHGDYSDFGSGDFADLGSGMLLAGTAGAFQDLGSGGYAGFGSGDHLNFGSGDFTDLGSGDYSDLGSGDWVDLGAGDFTDLGSGDFTDLGSGLPQELDYDLARALGRTAPHGATACVLGFNCSGPQPQPFDPQYHNVRVQWKATTVGHVFVYRVYRIYGDVVTPQTLAGAVQVGADVPGTQLTTIDTEELPDGQKFTYFVKAIFDDDTSNNVSGPSNYATVTAINDAPVALPDTYSLMEGTPKLTVTTPGVLANDTDDDTANRSLLRAVLVTTTANGQLTLAADGSFTYAPNSKFVGIDTFIYKANDGFWSFGATTVPMSPDSNIVTVTIVVEKRPKK